MNILEERLFNKFGHRFKVVRRDDNSFEIKVSIISVTVISKHENK